MVTSSFSLLRLVFVLGLVIGSFFVSGMAQSSGTVNVQASVSSYVDVTAGGPVTLSGTLGGSVNNTLSKGSPLNGTVIDLGDVGPNNNSAFAKATLPLRLRSNAPYTLNMSVQDVSGFTGNALTTADIGFGVDNVSRSDPGVAAGTDTITTGVQGDPTLDPDANPSTPRWDYSQKKNLAFYTTAAAILTGPKIMKVQPKNASTDGLTLNTFFAVKPQFFDPTTANNKFSANVTFTITSP